MWTELNKKMVTSDGNIRRYLNSDVVDIFVGGDSADISYPNGYGKGNRVHSGYVPCLASASIKQIIVKEDNMNELRIRKLTPKECWRLMGFDDSDFEKAAQVNSNAQLYKQAGNSIVVDVLVAIIRNLLLEPVEPKGQTNIFEYI
jgi:DNA (cytosine-5)-methyltransferase 1